MPLPVHLRRGVVVVQDFVPDWEQPPVWWASGTAGHADADWREIRALRRWQAAVQAWGAQHGLSTGELGRLGYWPGRPPPFAAGSV
ncbi:MAG: hypothetical protein ACRDQU_08975 [Pseudonocardiaceae bacterium]